ncbi:MAG: transglycosylase SLT domain-containing protein, partial [Pseudomonadota bacterium]
SYRLRPVGFEVAGKIEMEGLSVVREIQKNYGDIFERVCAALGVPVELGIATCATESAGKPRALRKEPGYRSDAATPHRVSPGLMQTLISTAQQMVNWSGYPKDVVPRPPGNKVTRSWLYQPENSIACGVAYIAYQSKRTALDPPLVFAAYNAGGVYVQGGESNRWKTRQYPIGTGAHVDRAVNYFNACFAMWGRDGGAPEMSLVRLVNGPVAGEDPDKDEVETPTGKGPWEMLKNLLNIGGIGGLAGMLGQCEQVQANTPDATTMLPILILVILGIVNGGDIKGLIQRLLGSDTTNDEA